MIHNRITKSFHFLLSFLMIFTGVPLNAGPRPGINTKTLVPIHLGAPIPLTKGKIKATFTPSSSSSSGLFIYHIQDAHCNFQAQKNIRSLVQTWIEQEGIDLVCVEGAKGPIDSKIFESLGTP